MYLESSVGLTRTSKDNDNCELPVLDNIQIGADGVGGHQVVYKQDSPQPGLGMNNIKPGLAYKHKSSPNGNITPGKRRIPGACKQQYPAEQFIGHVTG